MRRPLLVLLPVALLSVVGFMGRGDGPPFDPRFANIVAACTPGSTPQVQPQRVVMSRQDSVVWRVTSGQASSWTITPKDPQNWLFDQTTFTGTPASPAVTRRPSPDAVEGRPYAYNVSISCPDGSSQLIDPDIVIGGAQ